MAYRDIDARRRNDLARFHRRIPNANRPHTTLDGEPQLNAASTTPAAMS